MFITPAFAQAAGGTGMGGGLDMFLIFIPIILIMYFLIIRPQRQQMKKRQELLNSVRRGDTVVTAGGVIAKVVKVFDESGEVELEVAENVKIRVLRATISDIRGKTDAGAEKAKSDSKEKPAKKPAKASKKDEAPAQDDTTKA